MTEYRAYAIGLDGHFTGVEPLICADNAEAIEQAKRLADVRHRALERRAICDPIGRQVGMKFAHGAA